MEYSSSDSSQLHVLACLVFWRELPNTLWNVNFMTFTRIPVTQNADLLLGFTDIIFRRERSGDRKYVCCLQAIKHVSVRVSETFEKVLKRLLIALSVKVICVYDLSI